MKKKRIIFFLLAALILLPLFLVGRFTQAAPPSNFQTTQIIGTGLNEPTGFEFAPDGRIFILERAGKIKIYKNGQLLAQPFADLPSAASGDRGLIGVTFDPDFANNHWVYFYYTSSSDLLNRIVRFDATGDVGTNGPVQIFQTTSPSVELHVGGTLAFGPDGKLYFAVGDNGYGPNAQDLSNPHGKIHRINKDGTSPNDNPFYGQSGKLASIWAYGFRNPWRFQFDKSTGRIFGGDVGEFTWEEVNRIEKGNNYGWPQAEGMCSGCPYINPIYTYNHDGQGSAVTGGPVYRASSFPSEYRGSLFFGDYARGFIKRLTLDANGNSTGVFDFDTNAGSVVDLKVAPDGSMYYVTFIPGRLYRITYSTTNQTPTANATADVTKGTPPLTVHFSSSGSSDPDGDPLTYVWDFGDGTQSNAPNPIKTYNQQGTFTVQLTVSDGTNTAQAVPIVIQVGIPPTISIGAPQDGSLYNAGDTILYSASAEDGAGFEIPESSMSVEIIFHHNTHTHPFLGPIQGKTGQFTIPTTGESSADTRYEVKVRATDSNGLTTTKSVIIHPRKVNFTLASSPPGIGVFLDGIPQATPQTIQGVVGFRRELSASETVTFNSKNYQFQNWSDGGAITHFITTPPTDTTYTATYQEIPAFTGQYFNNISLSGTPALTRQDAQIDFNWSGSPASSIGADNFSVRWTKSHPFTAGTYKFTTSTDDGVRLYIDGVLKIDKWIDQGTTSYSAIVDLTAGNHEIKMEYYERGGGAVAKLVWESTTTPPSPPPPPTGTWQAQYWDNQTLSGSPKITRNESAVNFVYNDGSPDPQIPNDHFSARFTKTDTLTAGTYEFTVTADDGVRLYLDNQLIIDKWIDQGATTYKTTRALTAGDHAIKVEYYENGGGAVIAFDYKLTDAPPPPPPPPPGGGYSASYWNVPGTGSSPTIPTTTPILTRTDAEINFDWGSGSPDGSITADHFVTRWTSTKTFEAATYKFSTISDDGIRVYVDNQLIIDQWNDHGSTLYEAEKAMTAGDHAIKVEYYENGGGAVAKFSFAKTTTTPPPPSSGTWQAEYFDNQFLSGVAKVVKTISEINLVWNDGSPDPQIPNDHFSARFTRTENLSAGTYEFTVTADDGVRLYVDGVLIIDKWIDQGATTYKTTRTLASGDHTIKIEYYENGGGAVMIFAFKKL